MPSMISTPVRSVHARPTGSGKASPAEPQRRNACSPRAGKIRRSKQRTEQRRHAEEDRGPLLAKNPIHFRRFRTPRKQNRCRTHGKRERQRVAQSVGKEQLRRRVDPVIGVDSEHALPIQLSRFHQAGVHMNSALWPPGRSRRVQPEAGVIGPRRIRLASGRSRRHEPGKFGIGQHGYCPQPRCFPASR